MTRLTTVQSHSLPTVYLDFDGVLHPSLTPPDQHFSRLQVLAPLQSLDFAIVISSSWRFHHSQRELATHLGVLGEKVIGCTGPAAEGRHARWHEVCRHAESRLIYKWIAVDDSVFEFPRSDEVAGKLILCNGATGITEAEVRALTAFLQR